MFLNPFFYYLCVVEFSLDIKGLHDLKLEELSEVELFARSGWIGRGGVGDFADENVCAQLFDFMIEHVIQAGTGKEVIQGGGIFSGGA